MIDCCFHWLVYPPSCMVSFANRQTRLLCDDPSCNCPVILCPSFRNCHLQIIVVEFCKRKGELCMSSRIKHQFHVLETQVHRKVRGLKYISRDHCPITLIDISAKEGRGKEHLKKVIARHTVLLGNHCCSSHSHDCKR